MQNDKKGDHSLPATGPATLLTAVACTMALGWAMEAARQQCLACLVSRAAQTVVMAGQWRPLWAEGAGSGAL